MFALSSKPVAAASDRQVQLTKTKDSSQDYSSEIVMNGRRNAP